MGVFHQIGHNSINLVKEKRLNQFGGLLWSPVNYSTEKVTRKNLELPKALIKAFDPQLYFPDGEKENLLAWDYYPADFETTDNANKKYWDVIAGKLIDSCRQTGCSFLCSPVSIPKHCNIEYYNFFTECANYTVSLAIEDGLEVFQTVVIKLDEIDKEDCIEELASVVSRTKAAGVYLVFLSSVAPRRELNDAEQLFPAMKLIYLLKQNGLKVLVGFCSTDFVLWRYAGADDIATGKFFNLRRFTATRFWGENDSKGRGQLSYLFDKSLMTFLREGDVLRLDRKNLLDSDIERNPYNIEILNRIRNHSGVAWTALSWCSYLYSIMILEAEYRTHDSKIKDLLLGAEQKWEQLREDNILMEEIPNDGSWIREWRIALNEFDEFLKG